jgi:hypothetical protein
VDEAGSADVVENKKNGLFRSKDEHLSTASIENGELFSGANYH